MATEQPVTEDAKPAANTAGEERMPKDWKAILDSITIKSIVKNIPFLMYVTFLLILLIANSYQAIDVQREINKEDKKLKELHWKYMDVKTKLLNTGTEADIIRRAAALGLKPIVIPAYTI